MKTLWMTLLASIILCFGIFRMGNKEAEKRLLTQLKGTNLPLIKTINYLHHASEFYSLQYTDEYDYQFYRLMQVDSLIKYNSPKIKVATTKKESIDITKEWSTFRKQYLDKITRGNKERQKDLNYQIVFIHDEMYHSAKIYQDIIAEVMRINIQAGRIYTSYHIADDRGRRWHFYSTNYMIFDNLKLQKGVKSDLPIVLNREMFYNSGAHLSYIVKKLWINDQLIFDSFYDGNPKTLSFNDSYELVYNGKKNHTVRFEIQDKNDIQTFEYTYDSNVNQCLN